MKRTFIIIITWIFFTVNINTQSVDVEHFLRCPSVNGVSGFAYIPSVYVLHSNKFSLGLHRFEFKANYGLFDILEAGVYFDFSSSSNLFDILKNGKLNLKLQLLNEEQFFLSSVIGIEQCPLNIFEQIIDEDCNIYFAVSKKILDASITVGLEKNLTGLDPDITDAGFFIAVSKVIYDTILLVAEYERGIYNGGFKISMNSNITIDFFVRNINKLSVANSFGDFLQNYFIFGIDYIQ
ncbi:MAG: hypothetical protein N3E50_05345 [Candidatus Goldbacteria bacterium]|nr:hypothetical protein [Candidatus Goldiibacteriota bacterium]